MNAIEAAERVLAEAGEPLHVREITQRMLAAGLWTTSGTTPAATVESRLAVDIKAKGSASRFHRVAKSTFTLNKSSSVPSSKPTSSVSVATSSKALTFTDAAEKVLERYGGGKPMHYIAITNKALQDGQIVTAGQTPEATMYAQILTEIERQTKRGEQPRFTKLGKGLVGLTKWQPHGIVSQIDQHNRAVRRKLHAQLHAMPPTDFEALIGRLLTALGFVSVGVTPISNDGGIDVRGQLVIGAAIRINMAVQVKRWKSNVQAPTVQQVRGSLVVHEQGLIITTSDFSKGAREEATRLGTTPVALMNGEELVSLLVEHRLGVRRITDYVIELGEDDKET